MNKEKNTAKIDFTPVSPEHKALYESYDKSDNERGCEFTFANLYMWGQQNIARLHGHLVLFSHFGEHKVYPWPLGKGDKKAVIDSIMADAEARGIPCCISGLCKTAVNILEELYPGRFTFSCDDGFFDYVYDINDLAELKGKKYHGKRNHLNRFREAYPDYRVEEINEKNLPLVKSMAEEWYRERLENDLNGDFDMEHVALDKALKNYKALGMEGLILMNGDDIMAFTMGSRLSDDTFDVHFEKADGKIQGAYTAINCEFARYIRDKYPEIRYLDREEDMGIEGLRKAKRSYYPHHQVEKCRAHLRENVNDN